MITAKEARNKVLGYIINGEKCTNLIKYINRSIEYSCDSYLLSTSVFLEYRLDFVILEALKTYYTDLGYVFEYRPNYKDDVSTIFISW